MDYNNKYDENLRLLELLKQANSIQGVRDDRFIEIHKFLDCLNNLLDGEFNQIKKVFYKNVWKLGFAYYEYDNRSLTYSLYPIHLDTNNSMIKKVDEELHSEIWNAGLGFRGIFDKNPVHDNPELHALEIIEDKYTHIFKSHSLKFDNSKLLIQEYLVAFIYKFSEQMGLPKKESYTIKEARYAFNYYLYAWVTETVKYLIKEKRNNIDSVTKCLTFKPGIIPYIDPDSIICNLSMNERETIRINVEKKIKEPDFKGISTSKIPIGNATYKMKLFPKYLEVLQEFGFRNINNPYKRLQLEKSDGYLFNSLTKKEATFNLKKVFKNLIANYDNIRNLNFAGIHGFPMFFDDKSLSMVVKVELKDKYTFMERPLYRSVIIKGFTHPNDIILLKSKDKMSEIFYKNKKCFVTINGKTYQVVEWQSGSLDFLYSEFPSFNFIESFLKKQVEEYFKTRKKAMNVT